ncbi:MAG TPA: LLM class flavin-dependent oxidoreductase [Candidatus Limnocylindrales bacterium]|nr:LLM class flavin-dependent oxidoreductase [Candidatus Limnocylindrales bacterium]
MTRPLKVGVQLPEVERVVRWPEQLAMARAVEAVGFDAVWVGDHLLYRWPGVAEARGPWECWTMLAAIAASTSRISLGPLVASTSFHAPAMLAKQAATVDEISGGRLILGLGAGWNETEYTAFGFPFDHRISRFEEAFTIIRTLLREGSIDFDGVYYQARDCELRPRPARPGGPPLMLGSLGERMLQIGAPYIDSWNAWYDATGNAPAGVPALIATVDAAARAAGRDPAEIERTVAVLVQMPGGIGRFAGNYTTSQLPALSGPPQVMAEELRAYARAGIGAVQLVLDPITEASIEAFGPVLELLDAG